MKQINCFKTGFCLAIVLAFSIFLSLDRQASAITIIDAAGQAIVLEKIPERIVVAGNAPFIALHMLYLFEEAKERITGFEIKIQKPDDFLRILDPNLSEKKTLNSNPGPESIAALKPDLVITKAQVKGPLTNSLNPLGIPVVHLGVETPELFLADIRILGQVFGNPARAEALCQYFQSKLAYIREKTDPGPAGKNPRVLVLEYSNRGKALSLNVPAESWIQTRQAVIAGGEPVWLNALTLQDGWQTTGFEQIAAWNPEKIFLIVWYQLQGPKVLHQLYQDSKWTYLAAVQKKQLFLFPKDIYGWDASTPRWILGALWMAQMTWPENYTPADPDLKTLVMEFFRTAYLMDDNTIQNHILPEMQ